MNKQADIAEKVYGCNRDCIMEGMHHMMERPPRDPEHAAEDHEEMMRKCECNMPVKVTYPESVMELFAVNVPLIRATELEQHLTAELNALL